MLLLPDNKYIEMILEHTSWGAVTYCLKHYYWKPYFWSLSYFIGSVSEKTTSAVKHYIQHQKD